MSGSIRAAAGVIQAAQEQGQLSAAGIAAALDAAGLLMSPEAAAELKRLRALMASEPVSLSASQIDVLAAAGNRALNTAIHDDLCACDAWPERCLSSGAYWMGYWDTGALDTAMPAVIGLWEAMRGGELAALRDRIEELLAQRDDLLAEDAERSADEDPIRYELTEAADAEVPPAVRSALRQLLGNGTTTPTGDAP